MISPVIGIIGGKGQMGKLFAAFFREQNLKVLISDQDTRLTNIQLAARADIVIISVPIEATESVINEVLPYLKSTAAIMDLTSVKEAPAKAMMRGNNEVLGMHPMFGSTNPIPGQTIILCTTKKSGPWSRWIEQFFLDRGVKIEHLTPREHDKVMNIAQGLIHFAEIVFADAIRRCKMPLEKLLKFTGKASELKILLAARILAQDSTLYGNIQIQNPASLHSLRQFIKSTQDLYKIVSKKDLKSFKSYFHKNQKFFQSHCGQAYKETSHLIDCLLLYRHPPTPTNLPKQGKLSPRSSDLALLGPAYTYSDEAAKKYISTSYTYAKSTDKKYYCHDISEIFDLVEKGKVGEGIVPAENKIEGTVRQTFDNLFSKKVHIVGQVRLPINHCLIGLKTSRISDIKLVLSHEQALNQCQKYIQKHIPKAEKLPTPSTTAALEILERSQDKSFAVIASLQAASSHPHLKVLSNSIQDSPENYTDFYLIRKGDFTRSSISKSATRTAIVFHFDKDSPGTLATVFQAFSKAKINLTRIESRPTKARFGDYLFYLDFEGLPTQSRITTTLKLLNSKVAFLKILGTY